MSFSYLTMAMCMFFSRCFCLFPLYIRMSFCILWWIFDLSIGIPRRMAPTYVYVCLYVCTCMCMHCVSFLARRRERSDACGISLHLWVLFLHMAE